MTKRLILTSFLTLLSYLAGFFSLWVQLDPFAGGSAALPVMSAASGGAFAAAALFFAGKAPPRGFALVGLGVSSAAVALAGIVIVYG